VILKKLVCADEIKAAAEKGQKLFCVENGTIITPAAKDLARELGVTFSGVSETEGNSSCNNSIPQKTANSEAVLDRDLIYQVVKAVLANQLLKGVSPQAHEEPFLCEGQVDSGLKIIRGRSVKFENFDTGNPSTNVAYREVISKDDSQMSAGFLTIEKSSFDWELCYEEIDIILEGSLSITLNGETFEACQGDVLFVPKGSKVTWRSSGYVKLFYVTYPANWPELMAKQ
jgi:ethanolamine utilization protein EutQ